MLSTNRFNAVFKYKAGKAGFGILRITMLLIVMLLLCVTPVLADPALPDSTPVFSHIYINRSLIEANDFLIYAEYDIPYAVLPTDNASLNYIFELIDDDGVTKLGTALPYPEPGFDNGYNEGVTSFYFPAITAPTWGDNYTLRVVTNPSKFTTITAYDTAIGSAYSLLLATDVDGNQMEVADNLRNTIITDLEIVYGYDLLASQDTGIKLTLSGESYFRNVIPELQVMAPDLFYVQGIEYDTSERTWGTSLSDFYQARLAGVDGIVGTADDNWIMASLTGVADWLNAPYILIVGIIFVAVCVWLIRASIQRFGTAVPGYAGSLLVVSCGGMLTLGFTVVAIIAFALILIGGWFIFMRHA